MRRYFEEDKLSEDEARELLNSYIGKPIEIVMTYEFDDDASPRSKSVGENYSVCSVMELKLVSVNYESYVNLIGRSGSGKTEFTLRPTRGNVAFYKVYDTTLHILGFFDNHVICLEVRFK